MTPEDIIALLDLEAHPEGGWYREIYRAGETIPPAGLPERFAGPRVFATSIYYLLTAKEFSALHRIRSDEQWHFYSGGGLQLHILDPAGEYQSLLLGGDLSRGETFHAVVPAGCWFGATLVQDAPYALVGCTVAPGFDFADFELGSRAELQGLFPQHRSLISGLTRN